MLNLLIADNNIEYVKKISNTLLYNNEEIRLVKIASNVNETLEYIEKCKIDLIILDCIMSQSKELEVLEKLKKEGNNLYNKPKVIIASNDTNSMFKISKDFDVLDVIDKNYEIDQTVEIINKNIENLRKNNDKKVYEKLIYKELLNLKYNLKHNGTKYIMESILYIINSNKYEIMLDNLEKKVYYVVANKYGKSVANIKNNIVKATNNMYSECSINYLMKYFKYDCDKKPTPKMVIATIVNKLVLKSEK